VPVFALFLFFLLAVLSPLLFGRLMLASLEKLHLDPSTAVMLMIAIFVGGLINIPITTISRGKNVSSNPLAVYGLDGFWPQLQRNTTKTIIAVNLGGCVIPVGLSLYEIWFLASMAPHSLALSLLGCTINIVACYFVARPVKGIGIVMPTFASPLIAVTLALLLVPETAPPAAFVIGVIGPLVGADLLHLRDIEATETGIASIGGAGTFDGIILSGIIAAYLA